MLFTRMIRNINRQTLILYVIIGQIIILVACSKAGRCEQQIPEAFTTRDFMACSSIDCNEGSCTHSCGDSANSPLSLNLDSERGKLEVEYQLYSIRNFRINKLTIMLLISEGATSEQCANKSPSLKYTKHSERILAFEWCDDPNKCSHCQDKISVIFDYIYSACYKIKVIGYNGPNSKLLSSSCPSMLETKYRKKGLYEMKPSLAPMYHPESYFTLDVNVNGTPEVIYITLIPQLQKSNVKLCEESLDTVHSCCFYDRMFNTTNRFLCEGIRNSTLAQCYMTDGNGYEIITCTFRNVKPGNYCISISYSDDRCAPGTVWTQKECKWGIPFAAVMTNTSDNYILPITSHVREPEEFPYVLATSGLFMLIFVIFVIMAVYWKIHYIPRPIITVNDNWFTVIEKIKFYKLGNPKILLLYPRDCDSFMDAMAKFRQVLSRAKCEVYDCWDPDQSETVARCPTAWVQLLASDKSVKVIIVANDCSKYLEKNIFSNSNKTTYKKPQCYDDLFLYGMQCLSQSVLTDRYDKIFVVSLKERQNNKEQCGLTYLNPLVVFSLPIHLEKLILALHSVDASLYSLAMEIPEVISFHMAIEYYSRYKTSYPDYLNDIITREENEIENV